MSEPGNLTPTSKAIWRAVRDCGQRGMPSDILYGAFSDIPVKTLQARLRHLSLARYLQCKRCSAAFGKTSYVWHVGTKTPIGETAAPGTQPFIPASRATPHLPARPPNSIWALADQCRG